MNEEKFVYMLSSGGSERAITRLILVSETDKTVTYRFPGSKHRMRSSKQSQGYTFHSTFEAAKAALLDRLLKQQDAMMRRLPELKDTIERLKSMKEPQ